MVFRWKDTAICGYKSGKLGLLLKYPKLVGLKDVSFTTAQHTVLVKADVGEMSKDALDVVKGKVAESIVPVLDFLSSSYKMLLAKKLEHKPVLKTSDAQVSVSGSVANVTITLPDSWEEEMEIVHIYAHNGVLGVTLDVIQILNDYVESTKTKWDDYAFGIFKYGWKMMFRKFGEDDPNT